MVRQAVGGRGSSVRAIAVRLQSELGDTGEAVLVELTGGESIGRKRFASWKGSPPVDLIDHRTRIAYQSKVISEPKSTMISFSGAHRKVEKRKPEGGNIYFGSPDDKLNRIRSWLASHGWEGWKIVFLYDETANRLTVYSKRGVTNSGLSEMDPIATYNNDTGEWRRIPGTPDSEYPPGFPDRAMLYSKFPRVPAYLRSDITATEARKQLVQMGIFRRSHGEAGEGITPSRRPSIHVQRHNRRRAK
jgi:hypothetical protein